VKNVVKLLKILKRESDRIVFVVFMIVFFLGTLSQYLNSSTDPSGDTDWLSMTATSLLT